MSKGNTFENDILLLIYNATAIANLADNAAISPLTNIQVALHTSDPGESGDQTTNEATYTSYARVAVARTSGGWTVSGNSCSPVANIQFAQATGGSETLLYWSTGVAAAGASKIFHKGVIGSQLGAFTAATSNTITIPAHGLAVNDRIAFFPSEPAGLPTGISEGTVYHVITVPGADTITVSTTQGGSVVNITASGDGTAAKVTPVVVSSGVRPILTTATTIKED